jgi:SAM-dependent methyltransferase
MEEEEGIFSCTFLVSFLKRHGALVMPAVAFEDPRPFLHFASVPTMQEARTKFVTNAGQSLPKFSDPIHVVDIGCGDGVLTVSLIRHLVEVGKAPGVAEVLLVDASEGMITLAGKTVQDAFPEARVETITHRVQDISSAINRKFDIAVCSLSYHHMPREEKVFHLSRMRSYFDHLLLFELDANNDAPDLYSPDLSLSVYQSYGRIMDFVYAHDAPVDVVTMCVDQLLMTEAVSLLTLPRGTRSDYHMLKTEWHKIFREVLGPSFSCRCDTTCYGDAYISLFLLHYGRDEG